MKAIEIFKEQQRQAVLILQELLSFLNNGEEIGIEIDQKFINKLKNSIVATENDKLKIALIGGFSEGKTSIIAAWCDKYDKLNMNISEEESSNQVTKYSLDEFDLVDTPGLFGFKENTDNEKYKDITNKYVSEAHIVLYVMNPTNPIKEHHKEELKWLFRELNLLPRTVFVLSRFDEEVDIEDEDDYNTRLKIKRENIVGRLTSFEIIKNEDVSIVAVSANPFKKGFEYWLARPEEYKKLSRIETLQNATTAKIENSGGYNALVTATSSSIIADVLNRQLPIAIEYDEKIMRECERFSKMYNDIAENIRDLEKKIDQSKIKLREFVIEFFSDLILQLKGVDETTFEEFFQRNVGTEGIVLNAKIQNEFERHLGTVNHKINQVILTINSGIEQYNNIIGKVIGDFAAKGVKLGGKYLGAGGVKISHGTVKAIRDVLFPAIKFKPWQAVKIAGKINKALPIVGQAIGIIFEIGDSIVQERRKAQFKELIDAMTECFERQRKELIEIINEQDRFRPMFFPDYIALIQNIENIQIELNNKKSMHEQFKKWREQGEVIEAKYKIIR